VNSLTKNSAFHKSESSLDDLNKERSDSKSSICQKFSQARGNKLFKLDPKTGPEYLSFSSSSPSFRAPLPLSLDGLFFTDRRFFSSTSIASMPCTPSSPRPLSRISLEFDNWYQDLAIHSVNDFSEGNSTLKEWTRSKPLGVLHLDPADRAVLKIAGIIFYTQFMFLIIHKQFQSTIIHGLVFSLVNLKLFKLKDIFKSLNSFKKQNLCLEMMFSTNQLLH
jgi:hypothetical protein